MEQKSFYPNNDLSATIRDYKEGVPLLHHLLKYQNIIIFAHQDQNTVLYSNDKG
jgi:hypothetical protein